MVLKKIKQRNSEMGIGSLVISILIVIGFFLASYNYLLSNAADAGISIDSKYNSTYTNLTKEQEKIEIQSDKLQEHIEDISEADSTFQIAWNGLKGVGQTIKLTIYFITSAIGVWTATTFSISFIPPWALSIILVGITIFVVFIILRVFLQGKT